MLHCGVDPFSITRAALANLSGDGAFQGASTITQQLYDSRRDLAHHGRERTLSRKLQQTVWALLRELHCSKPEIIREYLKIVYLGSSFYGLDAATSGYFNTTRNKLDAAQGFFLAERIASPNAVSLYRVIELLHRRSVWAVFARNHYPLDELVGLYHDNFHIGGELCRHLERSPMLSDRLIRKY